MTKQGEVFFFVFRGEEGDGRKTEKFFRLEIVENRYQMTAELTLLLSVIQLCILAAAVKQ